MNTPQPAYDQRTRFLALKYAVACGLCYLPFHLIILLPVQAVLAIMLIRTEPKSGALVRLHAFQSLFLLLLTVAAIALGGVGEVALRTISGDRLRGLLTALGVLVLVGIFLFVLSMTILGMIKGFTGKHWKMPILGILAARLAVVRRD